MLGCAVRGIEASIDIMLAQARHHVAELHHPQLYGVHQNVDDPGHPALDTSRYYFDVGSALSNLVLWAGCISIGLGLAAMGSMNRVTSCPPKTQMPPIHKTPDKRHTVYASFPQIVLKQDTLQF